MSLYNCCDSIETPQLNWKIINYCYPSCHAKSSSKWSVLKIHHNAPSLFPKFSLYQDIASAADCYRLTRAVHFQSSALIRTTELSFLKTLMKTKHELLWKWGESLSDSRDRSHLNLQPEKQTVSENMFIAAMIVNFTPHSHVFSSDILLHCLVVSQGDRGFPGPAGLMVSSY